MDDPQIPPAELREALTGLVWTNRRLGGARALLLALEPYVAEWRPDEPLEVLDVGTGAADLPLALVELGHQLGRRVEVTAVDRSQVVVESAQRAVEDEPAVRVVRADALRLPFGARSFDVVTASLFLHHFDEAGVRELLGSFRTVARRAVVVNDLRRHVVPWLFIAALGRLLGRGRAYVHDGPLSVRRGFTPEELDRAARDAGAREVRVRRLWPYRLVLEIDARSTT
jgi:ubiquinone/menaquinone biosynthesis C-methylase UbiE